MPIISNNLIGKIPISTNDIIRVNLAWVKDVEEAKRIIKKINNDIYLDYPRGRSKPPKPTIKLDDAIRLANNQKVKYFAVSNIETAEDCELMIDSLGDVEFVPKIETEIGVNNMAKMIKAGVKTMMLDKEDLYTDVNCNSKKYNKLIGKARSYPVKLLELQGVVFI